MGALTWKEAIAVAAAAAVVVSIAVGGPAAMRALLPDPVADVTGTVPATVRIDIAGEPLTVPTDLVRFADQRRPGPKARVDLALVWPSMEGLDPDVAARIHASDPTSPIVFIGIERREGQLDTSSRVAAVYGRFFDGAPFQGPAGLVGQRMKPGSGYEDELVYFEAGSVRPFAARCFALEQDGVATLCLREVLLGRGLSATYRFRFGLLRSWQQLDRGMTALLADFVDRAP